MHKVRKELTSEQKEKIKEYKQIWKDTKEALDLLNKEK